MKNLSYFLLSFVLFFSSGVFAQGHSKDTNPNKDKSEFEKPQHKHPHKELLKKERTEFEKVLSESEKATIEKARIELKSLKSTYKKKDKSELTKEEWAQIMEKKKAIMLPVSEIAKTHETELNGVIKKLHEQKMDYKKGKECQGKKEDACKKDKSDSKKGKGKSDKGEHHKGKGQCGDKMPESRHANMSKEEMTLKFGVKFLLKKPSAEKVEIENDSPAIATDAKIKNGTLYFNHPFDGIVNIDLIDKEGKLMRNILNDFLDAGPQEIDLKMNELSTGELYFIRLSEGGRVSTHKFIKTE